MLCLQALSAADLSLVLYVCRTADPVAVFSESPCQLTQPVLLSLIQQLSANFDTEVELKHRFVYTPAHGPLVASCFCCCSMFTSRKLSSVEQQHHHLGKAIADSPPT